MSKIDDLIQELCPDGVQWNDVGRLLEDKHLRTVTPPYKMKKVKYDAEGLYPIIDQGQSFIVGYTSNESYATKQGNYVIFGDHTESFKYIDFAFVQGADGIKIIESLIDSLDAKYLYYALSYCYQKTGKYTRHFSFLKKTSIPIPPIPIQQEIVRILDSFTKLEAELEAELEARKKQYNYYRNQLLTPKEIDGKWYLNGKEVELKPLGELIFSLKTGLNPRKNFVLNPPDAKNYYVTVRELSGTSITIYDKTDRVDDDALVLINNRSNLDRGDVLFSGTGTIGRTALVKVKPKNWNIKEGVYTIKPNQSRLTSMYLIYTLNSQFSQKQINDKTVGSPVCSIPMADLKRIIIPVPAISEQERLAAMLERFDTLVNDISIGLPAEIAARRKQYEYYRGKLLSFKIIAEAQEA